MVIKTGVENLRDPFLLYENGVYYMYGTGVTNNDWNTTVWACYKNTDGKLDGKWEKTKELVYKIPENAVKQFWAPEVHKYKDNFYMFATYYSSATERRGCSILKAPTPEGPFVEITKGHITPKDWDAIDGTLYVDDEGQPWMVFVHEFCSLPDKIGRMAAAKLSEDFTHFISEPIELFRADDPSWTNREITDGCFMYKTKNNTLIMIWSNFIESGYCAGIARSDNGKIDGNWSHDEKLLISREILGVHDVGHGMIFKDTDDKMYLSVHSPNVPTKETGEEAIFIELKEEKDGLVCLI